jgi:hypothetical protein
MEAWRREICTNSDIARPIVENGLVPVAADVPLPQEFRRGMRQMRSLTLFMDSTHRTRPT